MSGNWEGGAQPPAEIGQPPGQLGFPDWHTSFPNQPASPAGLAPGGSPPLPPPDLSLVGEAEAPKRSQSYRRRIAAVAVAISVVAAFALVATVNSRASGVHAALVSVFSSPTLKVVVSAHSTNAEEQAMFSQYSVALTVTSENGRQPLSGSDGVDHYEFSVLRGGVDLGDVVITDHAVYARVDFQAIDPSSYESERQSLAADVPPGPARSLALAFLDHQWIGIDDSTIGSFEKKLGAAVTEPKANVNFDNLRNSFTLSFAQSWDAWASIHELSSSNGVTEYSVKLPVRHFVSAFVTDLKGAILKAVPAAEAVTARSALNSASAAIGRIPASLEIPMTLSVSNGALTGLDITYKGNSVDLVISHPAIGVTAPAGAHMITTSIIQSLLKDYGVCLSVNGPAVVGLCASSGMGSSGIQSNTA